jgi:hypothetical protein
MLREPQLVQARWDVREGEQSLQARREGERPPGVVVVETGLAVVVAREQEPALSWVVGGKRPVTEEPAGPFVAPALVRRGHERGRRDFLCPTGVEVERFAQVPAVVEAADGEHERGAARNRDRVSRDPRPLPEPPVRGFVPPRRRRVRHQVELLAGDGRPVEADQPEERVHASANVESTV